MGGYLFWLKYTFANKVVGVLGSRKKSSNRERAAVTSGEKEVVASARTFFDGCVFAE